MPDRISDRPVQRGLPVPYLVPFWGEEPITSPTAHRSRTTDGHWRVVYPDEQPDDRDAAGALWTRMTSVERPTLAEMGQVHPHRQRDCMLTPRCQVCGDALPADAVPWVLPLSETEPDGTRENDRFLTATPPTCVPCARVARRLCPLLRGQGSRLYTVRAYQPWGVIGRDTSPAALAAEAMNEPLKSRWVGYHHTTELHWVIAEQLIVELLKFSVVDAVPARVATEARDADVRATSGHPDQLSP